MSNKVYPHNSEIKIQNDTSNQLLMDDSKNNIFNSQNLNSKLMENMNEYKNPNAIRNLNKMEKIVISIIQCDSDSEDYDSDQEIEVNYIIDPDQKYKRMWDIFIGV